MENVLEQHIKSSLISTRYNNFMENYASFSHKEPPVYKPGALFRSFLILISIAFACHFNDNDRLLLSALILDEVPG